MHTSQFTAVIQLFASGGYIGQVSDTPLSYRIHVNRFHGPLKESKF